MVIINPIIPPSKVSGSVSVKIPTNSMIAQIATIMDSTIISPMMIPSVDGFGYC